VAFCKIVFAIAGTRSRPLFIRAFSDVPALLNPLTKNGTRRKSFRSESRFTSTPSFDASPRRGVSVFLRSRRPIFSPFLFSLRERSRDDFFNERQNFLSYAA